MNWEDGDAPPGWTLRTLGDVAKVVGGGTPNTTVAGNFADDAGHPWITPADLTGYTKKTISRGRRFLTDQGLGASSAKYMPAGTVLFSSRAPIGYVAIAANPVTTNQGFRSFVPSDELDSDYLYHAMRLLRPLAEKLSSGTTFAEISGSTVAKLPIAFPSLKEQRAIAKLLDTAAEAGRGAANHLASSRQTIERFRQSLLAAACCGRLTVEWRDAHPDAVPVEHALNELAAARDARRTSHNLEPFDLALPDVPPGYMVATIRSAARAIEYGTSKKADVTDEGIPVLRMGNIQDGRLDLQDLKYCLPDREIEGLILQDGDLLFNRTNSPELVGKAAVFHETATMTFASYLIRVQFAPEVANPDFVNYWINSAWGKAWARHVKTDGVSQSNINGTKLGAMPLPLPPIDEQREIVRRASPMLKLADELFARVDSAHHRIERASQAVLAKAFRGELLVPAVLVDE